MKITFELKELHDVVKMAVETALLDRQKQLNEWKYFTLKETADLLQIKPSTLLDKRMPYLNEIEYSQNGKTFWFSKNSVESFISSRVIRKYRR